VENVGIILFRMTKKSHGDAEGLGLNRQYCLVML